MPDGRDPRSADGLTPEFRAAVNLMCNRSLKAMLAEDRAEIAELQREVSSLVQHFSAQDPPTARFLRVVLSLLNSNLPAEDDLRRLREDYALAFDSMWNLLDDAGWAVRRAHPGTRDAALTPPLFACAQLLPVGDPSLPMEDRGGVSARRHE